MNLEQKGVIKIKYNIIENKSKIYFNSSIWESNNFGEFTIIGKTDRVDSQGKNCYYLCQFKDGTVVESNNSSIKRGRVKNYNLPIIYNKGFLGLGEHKSSLNDIHTREYVLWRNMMQRCYSEKYYTKNPRYKNVTVCERWHNFQNFCEDIQELENYDSWANSTTKKEYDLDKDVLCDKMNIRNKIYSPKTCIFINKTEHVIYSRLTNLVYIAEKTYNGIKYTEEFTNQTEFAKRWGLKRSNVNMCIKGKNKTTHGWTFKIKSEV